MLSTRESFFRLSHYFQHNQDMTASLADDMMRFYDGTVVVVGS